MPRLLEEEVTATYSGLRAATDHGDYLIECDARQRYVLVGGIRSTGLTSGMAVAERIESLLQQADELGERRTDLPAPPRMPNIGEAYLRPYQDPQRIAADPAYGTVVCFCERVTAGEIRDAYTSLIPPAGLGRTSPPHAGHERTLPGLLLRCGGQRSDTPPSTITAPIRIRDHPHGERRMTAAALRTQISTEVAIIGAGPAGLSAASRLAGTHRAGYWFWTANNQQAGSPPQRPRRLRHPRLAHLHQRPGLRPPAPTTSRNGRSPHRDPRDGHRDQPR